MPENKKINLVLGSDGTDTIPLGEEPKIASVKEYVMKKTEGDYEIQKLKEELEGYRNAAETTTP